MIHFRKLKTRETFAFLFFVCKHVGDSVEICEAHADLVSYEILAYKVLSCARSKSRRVRLNRIIRHKQATHYHGGKITCSVERSSSSSLFLSCSASFIPSSLSGRATSQQQYYERINTSCSLGLPSHQSQSVKLLTVIEKVHFKIQKYQKCTYTPTRGASNLVPYSYVGMRQ